ncbi:SVP1-like protein 2 [Coccidioides immitis RS]|uniref:SVP1-like protein 2 n=3 Tax=Coccidioides immitis TaxID=5501 RepID=J3K8W5_COCIM|nr:SVP1-like protein 2 [Coccidioides immitis RS]EAS31300.3 SVP1-like protein 2 [Coccidioides immitis RS]KMP03932.1 WD repeat domain phosphoinositide-interacting protein 4 [Coccidioides immitis RMSCC 2394]KMU86090.1 WD repeat domain phosphoinositide-interacting protein 4 [Coccidioides immitis H538.4]TPX24125.1 Phosphatidylinositol 3,5-bisphosphate-binding protein [Coccidioides immitis]
MDTRQVIDTSTGPGSLSVAFNSDSSCFSVGLDSGFCVFNSDPCELKVSRDFNAGIGVVEMLGQSNYLALVGGGRRPKFPQNKLIIWDDAKQKAAITLEFRTSVLRVRLTRSRVVVALHNSVHVFAFSVPPQKLSVFETVDNPLGLLCLGQQLLAFPGRSPGQVQVVELETGNVSIIPAHSSPLRALTLSSDGALLATASETGTLIRVFATSNCAKIAELRRGLEHADIFSLGISPSNTLLAVTSDKSTLHVFDLPHARNPSPNSQPPQVTGEEALYNKWGFLGKIPLLPRLFSDVYSFASAPFEIGDETPPGTGYIPQLGSSFSRPPKGVIGWTSDDTLLLIGAGKDGRWERFIIQDGQDGKRVCTRTGWKRYLGS